MSQQHNKEEVLSMLGKIPVVAVATAAGETLRNRMMHYAYGEDFTVYLASMKGDPKITQLTHHPSISLLIHDPGTDFPSSREVEITGKVIFVRDEEERQKAFEIEAERSPIVKYLVETGNTDVLDCIKVVPEVVKYRIAGEVTQGVPPTVFEYPQNRSVVSDWELLKAKARSWALEVRAPFLTAAMVPVLLGTAIAWAQTGTFLWGYFLLALLAGLLFQAGTNVMNDYFDHSSRNDEVNQEFVRPFSGGSRIIQLGLLTPLEVLIGSILLFLLASLIGLYLAWERGPIVLLLGLMGIVSAVFYTGPPLNWASRGVGELVVGLNFGPLMTLGAYYVQAQNFGWVPILASIPVGLLIAAVLYINEFPDYAADAATGKRTLVVRLGRARAAVGYIAVMAAAYLVIVIGAATGALPLAAFLGLLTLPLALQSIRYASRFYAKPLDLAPANALTIIAHLALGLLLTLAYAWEGFGVEGIGYVMLLGLGFGLFVFSMYRGVERQRQIALGVRRAAT
ncbi:MAG: 1,4-dihydroxy-2-naphthoate octaprenyltransferase [Chloroflexi bacterium]|nr:1,4-dihydroxy-2-naphthoate octaprenyltransferase [Chloroflexota bacterium]